MLESPKEQKYMEVLDKESGKLLAKGLVIGMKLCNPSHSKMCCISFDRKWFFNVESERFIVNSISKQTTIDLDESLLNNYLWKRWQDHTGTIADIYRENDYSEIDPEVKPLCDELNKWKGVETVGSCCGHGQDSLWIQMMVDNINSINTILNIMRSPQAYPKMLGKFYISTDADKQSAMVNYIDFKKFYDSNYLYIVIMSKYKGEQAYKDAELLTRYLKDLRERIMEVEVW